MKREFVVPVHPSVAAPPRRRRSRRWLAGVGYLAALAAVAALVAGVTYGFFSAASPSASSTLGAGTVTLADSATSPCTATNLLPDGSTQTCTLKVGYGGSVPAYLGLDVLVATKAGAGGTSLYNPGDHSGDLQIGVTDDQTGAVTYITPTTSFGSAVTCPSGYTSYTTCYELTDLIVSTTPFTSSSSPVTFTTTLSIPTSSPTGYQGGAAAVVLTAHAAQSGNNTQSGCTGGQHCGSVSWS